MVAENDLMPGLSKSNTCKFEITTADPMRQYSGASLSENPAALAAVIARLKDGGIAEMLRHTTSLNGISPNFTARPYAGIRTSVEDAVGNIASSMHINISLCDKDGKTIFARSVPLLYHCANSIMQLQRHAALAALPNENSLSRVKSKSTVPNVIGIQHLKYYDNRAQNNGLIPSICVRDDMLDMAANVVHREQKYYRIENKLPGADADPFVCMAITLAGVYDAVTQNVRRTPTSKGKVLIKVAPVELNEKLYKIPDTHTAMVEKMRASKRVKELLGDQLYAHILREYGQPSFSH